MFEVKESINPQHKYVLRVYLMPTAYINGIAISPEHEMYQDVNLDAFNGDSFMGGGEFNTQYDVLKFSTKVEIEDMLKSLFTNWKFTTSDEDHYNDFVADPIPATNKNLKKMAKSLQPTFDTYLPVLKNMFCSPTDTVSWAFDVIGDLYSLESGERIKFDDIKE